MAQFRAIIRGQRGEVSRLGSKASGMVAHVDGWHTGATVRISHVVDEHGNGRDLVSVYRTHGSAPVSGEALVAEWFATEPIHLGAAVTVEADRSFGAAR